MYDLPLWVHPNNIHSIERVSEYVFMRSSVYYKLHRPTEVEHEQSMLRYPMHDMLIGVDKKPLHRSVRVPQHVLVCPSEHPVTLM